MEVLTGSFAGQDEPLYHSEDDKHIEFSLNTLLKIRCQQRSMHAAISYYDEVLTYGQLDQKADLLAVGLICKGVQPGEVIAIRMERSIETIVAIVGILRAGCVFLLIDPAYPEDRITYMLSNSGARYQITHQPLFDEVVTALPITFLLQDTHENIKGFSTEVGPEAISYLIYTSGTTGNPKGSRITHAGLINMITHHQRLFDMRPEDGVLQFASLSFDAAVFEVFLALLSGARLVLLNKETIYDKDAFLLHLKQQHATVTLLPPVFLSSLNKPDLSPIRILITGGEACNLDDARHYSSRTRFFNAYGPSEASVIVCIHEVKPEAPLQKYIPIGKAIDNIYFKIYDQDQKKVGKGETGELYIGGIGIAKGYINNEQLTAKAFVKDPYKPHETLYRTGDLVKEDENGDLLILGRADSQVKILGHRIELSEIESALQDLPYINHALVMVKEDERAQKRLIAYFTAQNSIPPVVVRNDLLKKLPVFMIPHHLVQINHFILTPNGKVDKKRLPEVDLGTETGETFSDAHDQKLADIWKETLGLDHVNREDHFFILGGHSLKAAELSSRVHKAFHVKLRVADIFLKPTFQELSELISRAEKQGYQAISQARPQRYYPLSSAQRRMYIMSNTDPHDVSYNVSVVLKFNEKLQKNKVEEALAHLIGKYEILRTRYLTNQGELVQEILDHVHLELETRIISGDQLRDEARSFIRPFDLSKAPVLRIGLLDILEGGCALVLDSHHIAVDGTSVGILVMDLIAALHGQYHQPPAIQYKDYAVWESVAYTDASYFLDHERFWTQMYASPVDFRLPVDNNNAHLTYKGKRLEHEFTEEQVADIYRLVKEQRISLFQFFLSSYFLFLSKYTRKNDLVIGTAVANRNLEEVQNMLGMFVNTLAIRQEMDQEWTFRELLQQVSDKLMQCFNYQEYPFEVLVERLGIPIERNRIPLIDTTIVVQNLDFFKQDFSSDLDFKYENNSETSKFGISVFIIERSDSFFLQLDYNTQLFKEETMLSFLKTFIDLVNRCSNSLHTKLKELELIGDAELGQIKELLNTDQESSDIDFDF